MLRSAKWWATGLLALVGSLVNAYPETPEELAARIDAQRVAQSQMDQTARRLETMLRVLKYQKLDAHEEHKLVEEAAVTLKGLSRQEMNQVLARLEKAKKDSDAAPGETTQAHRSHLVIMSKLRELALRREAIRSLAEAAARARRVARDEGRLQGTIAGEIAAASAPRQGTKDAQVRLSRATDIQRDLTTEVSMLLRQAAALEPRLDDVHKIRLKKGLDEAKSAGLIDRMNLIPAQMSAEGVIADRAGRLRPVLEETRQATETLLNMARMWREDEPATAALRRLDERVAMLENKLEEAQEKGGATSAAEEERREAQEAQAEAVREAKDLTKEAQTPEIKAKVPEVETPLREAADLLRAAQEKTLNNDPQSAAPLEEKAQEALAKAREKIDEALDKIAQDKAAAREAEHKNRLDRLAQNQAELTKKTEEAAKRPMDQTPPKGSEPEALARQQAKLAKEASDLAKSADTDGEAQALAEAARALNDAAKDLADTQTPNDNAAEAIPDQKKGLAAIEKARQELAAQAKSDKAAEEARKLHEKAAKTLAEAAKTQAEIADKIDMQKAEKKLGADAARELAAAEERVKNQVAEAIKDLANDPAAKQAQAEAKEANREIADAIQDLKGNKPEEAAKDARDAAETLALAAKLAGELADKGAEDRALALARKEDDLRGLPEAARRVAQALEDAKQAKAQAIKADETLKSATNLAKAQAKLAAEIKDAPETQPAAPAAEAAAADLKEGNLAEAQKDQQAALDKLPEGSKAAEKQKDLLEATKALAKSAEAAAMAETGAEQAEGLVPQALVPGLDKAEAALKAGQEAAKRGDAKEAVKQQTEAVKRLENTLGQLTLLAKAAEGLMLPEIDPSALALAEAPPMETPGEPMPGEPMNTDKPAPPKGTQNNGPATPTADKLDPAQLKDAEGMGKFLRLPAREREALLQAWTEGLPPAYAAMVQKYYRDLAKTKGSAVPMTPSR